MSNSKFEYGIAWIENLTAIGNIIYNGTYNVREHRALDVKCLQMLVEKPEGERLLGWTIC
jgi:hypothetical protein